MKQIMLRSIPEEVGKTVQKEAARKGMSLNTAIISLLERAVGTKAAEKRTRVLYHDLDHLAGLWIAATAMQLGLKLITTDGRYRQMPRIIVEWCAP